jgi:hypothetical protein
MMCFTIFQNNPISCNVSISVCECPQFVFQVCTQCQKNWQYIYLYSSNGLDWSRVSSGSIVSDYGRSGFDPQQGQRIFPLSSASRPVLGPTQPPVQWVPGVLSPGAKAQPGRDADHSPPSSAEVVNE